MKNQTVIPSILPALIIFSIEHILMPFDFDQDILWPCYRKNGTILDGEDDVVTYRPDVPAIFEKIKSYNIKIAVTYQYNETEGANQILNFFDWNKYISFKEIYPGEKLDHLKKIQEKSQIPYNQMIFFDYENCNTFDAEEKLGIYSIYIEYDHGLSMRDFNKALIEFERRALNITSGESSSLNEDYSSSSSSSDNSSYAEPLSELSDGETTEYED